MVNIMKNSARVSYWRLACSVLISSCLLPLVSCADVNRVSSDEVTVSRHEVDKPSSPRVQSVTVSSKSYKSSNVNSGANGGVTVYSKGSVTVLQDNLRIRMHGDIQFSADDSQVVAMSDDGLFEFALTDEHGVKHEVVVRSSKLLISYQRDTQQIDSVKDKQAIVAQLLPDLLKESALMAKSRVAVRLKANGYNLLQDYIMSVDSEGAKSTYIQHLLALHPLTAKQWMYWLETSGHFEQQHHQALVFQQLVMQMKALKLGFASHEFSQLSEKVALLDSHYKFEVYHAFLDNFDYQYGAFTQLITFIDSAHYQYELLMALIAKDSQAETSLTGQDIDDLVRLLDSEHYKAEVYFNVMDKSWFDAQALTDSMLALASDHYRVELLRRFIHRDGYEMLIDEISTAISYVESDHYKVEVFSHLLNDNAYSAQATNFIITQLPMMSSDHYQAQLISSIIGQETLTKQQISALKDSVFRLNNHQLQQMLNSRMTKLEKS